LADYRAQTPRRNSWRRSGWLVAGLLFAAVIAWLGYRSATADPVVRTITINVADYPSSLPATRIVLFSDVHVHGPDMTPQRVGRIVRKINALHPDIDIAAGDFIGNNWIGRDYSIGEAIAPLRQLKARYGVYAVLGNNDHFAGAAEVTRALRQSGVHVLFNEAASAGPISLGGLDGRLFGSRAALDKARQATYAAMSATPGIEVLVAHRPDEFVTAPQSVSLVLAGHTHCGQIVLPLIGPLETGSDYGRKYVCGVFRSGLKTLVVTAGLGTSHIPIRIGAPPDIWLISIESTAARSAQSSNQAPRARSTSQAARRSAS
jgi:hypothetical protein